METWGFSARLPITGERCVLSLRRRGRIRYNATLFYRWFILRTRVSANVAGADGHACREGLPLENAMASKTRSRGHAAGGWLLFRGWFDSSSMCRWECLEVRARFFAATAFCFIAPLRCQGGGETFLAERRQGLKPVFFFFWLNGTVVKKLALLLHLLGMPFVVCFSLRFATFNGYVPR